jgi:hypothetical protein
MLCLRPLMLYLSPVVGKSYFASAVEPELSNHLFGEQITESVVECRNGCGGAIPFTNYNGGSV